jgi:hypothetical protein
MTGGSDTSLLIDLAIVALLLVRQVSTRPLRENYLLPAILLVLGLWEFGSFLLGQQQLNALLHGKSHHLVIHNGGTIIAAVAGSLVLAAVTGAIRTPTVKIWWQDGQFWRRGNWLTAVLWIASLALHFGYDALVTHGKADSGVGSATVLLYFGVSLMVQRLILLARAARMRAHGDAPGVATGPQFSRTPQSW